MRQTASKAGDVLIQDHPPSSAHIGSTPGRRPARPASTASRVRPSPSGHNPAHVPNVTIADLCPRRSCTVLTPSPYRISWTHTVGTCHLDRLGARVRRHGCFWSCSRRGKLGNHRARHESNGPDSTTESGRGQGNPVSSGKWVAVIGQGVSRVVRGGETTDSARRLTDTDRDSPEDLPEGLPRTVAPELVSRSHRGSRQSPDVPRKIGRAHV